MTTTEKILGQTRGTGRQTLLLDADDTLWENNVYFERAIAAFISFVDHARHTPAEVRERLNAAERRTIEERGYGSHSFRISLGRCLEDLLEQQPTAKKHDELDRFVEIVTGAEVELLPGVREALERLGRKHRLILVTKGNELEQRDKLERSGLAHLFDGVVVLEEKTAAAYQNVGEQFHCVPKDTWMIGNSPRSDINPALAAGFHAVFIPHADTWVLEHEMLDEAPEGRRLLQLDSLGELADLLERADAPHTS